MTIYIVRNDGEELAEKIARYITGNMVTVQHLADKYCRHPETIRKALTRIRVTLISQTSPPLMYVAKRGANGGVMLTANTSDAFEYMKKHTEIAKLQNERMVIGTVDPHKVLSVEEAAKENAERNQS